MRNTTYTSDESQLDPSTDLEGFEMSPLPDREVIPPVLDARRKLLPVFRVWLVDGYTVLVHARTPGEAFSKAMDDAKAMLERTGLDRKMTPRQRRQATTVACYQEVV